MAEQFGRAARGAVARQVAERAAIEEYFPRRQVLVKIWAFGQVAYARPHPQIVQRPSENSRLAGHRTQHSHQDFEGGRLARAVRPQKAEDLAGLDPQTQPVQRAQTPLAPETGLVIMREVFDLDYSHSEYATEAPQTQRGRQGVFLLFYFSTFLLFCFSPSLLLSVSPCLCGIF